MAKSFNLTFEQVLKMSYCNMTMYCKILPVYNSDSGKDRKGTNEEKINADDPQNSDKVRKILFG